MQAIVLPAMLPHQALPLKEETESINFYVPTPSPFSYWQPCVLTSPKWITDETRVDELTAWCETALIQAAKGSPIRPDALAMIELLASTNKHIRVIADQFGLSREGFIRKFKRLVGMTPHAYRSVMRLNEARNELRQGTSPIQSAITGGFADQSHLGRCFKSAFGTTPQSYRKSLGQN
ncbi:MAG: helix-turn-helix domain-containing protein [Notoacmeibacter sp.]